MIWQLGPQRTESILPCKICLGKKTWNHIWVKIYEVNKGVRKQWVWKAERCGAGGLRHVWGAGPGVFPQTRARSRAGQARGWARRDPAPLWWAHPSPALRRSREQDLSRSETGRGAEPELTRSQWARAPLLTQPPEGCARAGAGSHCPRTGASSRGARPLPPFSLASPHLRGGCSCLENPMDRGAWQAAVRGVAKSQHDWATTTN